MIKIILFLFLAGIAIYFSSARSSPQVQGIAAIPTSLPTSTNIQVLTATFGPPLGFYPTEFTVKAGIPVRLEVYATENGRGCMGSITIPGLNNKIETFIKDQTNVFEFTPPAPGEYPIVCAMGIPHGFITVE